MEASQKRQPIVLYSVPLLPELEIKSLIINSLPQANLTPQNIMLRKEGKFQAFIMVPQEKVQEICALKTLKINNQNVIIKKSITGAQVFISRLPKSLLIEEIQSSLESDFGKIVKIHEGVPHQERQEKLRHCYIQFQNDNDAEKCLFSPNRIVIKNFQLKPSRAYSIYENDETDKKLFLKVITQYEDPTEVEKLVNDWFRKEGKLRERIRIQHGKATIAYISSEVADRVLLKFKGEKIGKYDMLLRPYAAKDSYTVFLNGLKPEMTQERIENIFKHYQPLVSSSVKLNSHNPNIINGTITFGSQQTYKRLLLEFKEDPEIKEAFVNQPIVTLLMSHKDRNDYLMFKKGKVQVKKTEGPLIPPAPQGLPPPPPSQLQYQMYNQMQQMPMQQMPMQQSFQMQQPVHYAPQYQMNRPQVGKYSNPPMQPMP